jgi:hypothetical protein
MKLLLFSLLLLSSLFANKVIYLSYEKVPSRIIKGEIFPITIKALSTVREFSDIKYDFSNSTGLALLNPTPIRETRGKYFYETFNFLSTGNIAKLPDIEASLVASKEYDTTTLKGEKLNIISLNPRKNFSNIIANNFELVNYKTTSYDKEHNIIIFVASASNSNIKAMRFQNVYKQGSESMTESYRDSRITYFVVVDKKLENFSFSYFNLEKNNFSLVNIPIIVVEDSVTTQSDLKPKDQSKERLKITIAGGIAIFTFIFILIRKKYIYLFFMLIPVSYMAYIAIPDRIVCIKEGTEIRLLPVENGTIFETTSEVLHLHKEGSALNFTKVKLQNEKIGWIKNEDICSY